VLRGDNLSYSLSETSLGPLRSYLALLSFWGRSPTLSCNVFALLYRIAFYQLTALFTYTPARSSFQVALRGFVASLAEAAHEVRWQGDSVPKPNLGAAFRRVHLPIWGVRLAALLDKFPKQSGCKAQNPQDFSG
jgi:hypothetical protein